MKTAISISDATFERVERIARTHGMSRSQFYARAAARYADALEAGATTSLINAVLDAMDSDEDNDFVTAAAHQVLAEDEEW